MMKSLAAKFAKFTTPAPEDIDPEDERAHGSSENESENEEARSHYVEVGKSALRQDEPEVDKIMYSSARTSRRDLDEIEEESESAADDSEEEKVSAEESESSSAEEEEQVKPLKKVQQPSKMPINQSGTQSAVSALLQQEQKELISRLSSAGNEDAVKGKAVSTQMKMYEGLLDARISLQKAITASHGEVEDPDQALASVCSLIAEIQTLRNKMCGNEAKKSSSKRSFRELADDTVTLDEQLAKRRENILSKWSRKVQLSSGNTAMQGSKFKSLNQSAARQVESVLGDMDRLLKRTQVNRSHYSVDGQVPQHSDKIFDDTDFYRILLSDLVDRRMAENNANGDSLKWTVAKQAKTKTTKKPKGTSKGRQLRYDINDKIVSFDAPRPNIYKWSEEQADDLFASLLGVTITMDEKEPTKDGNDEELEVEDFNLFG